MRNMSKIKCMFSILFWMVALIVMWRMDCKREKAEDLRVKRLSNCSSLNNGNNE